MREFESHWLPYSYELMPHLSIRLSNLLLRDLDACRWKWLNLNNFILGFGTIVFIVISTTFRPICRPAFFRCLSNSRTHTELRTTSFTESTGIACSDSVSHNRVQVLSIPVLLLTCCQDWTCRWLSPLKLREPTPIIFTLCVLLDSLEWILGTYKLTVLTWLGLLLLCMISTCARIQIFF